MATEPRVIAQPRLLVKSRNLHVETEYSGKDAESALKMVLNSKATGQFCLNISQGAVCTATWKERVAE